MTGLNDFEQEMIKIYDELEGIFPDALMQPVSPYDPDIDRLELTRLRSAGLGLAEVELADGIVLVTYIREPDHVVIRALKAIALAEQIDSESVPYGSHDLAIDSIKFDMPFPVLDAFIARQSI